MLVFSKIFPCIFICLITNQAVGQDVYFEGSVTYKISEFDQMGNFKSTPVDKQEIFFARNVILTKPISGPQPSMFGKIDVYLDSEKKIRYSIDHVNGIIKSLGAPPSAEKILPIEENQIGEETINGFKCDISYIKYIHEFEGPYGKTSDTLSCTYYNSREYKIYDLKMFGLLQGNRNSLFLDGRYNGVPLKVILRKQDGSIILFESERVRQMNVDEYVRLPSYKAESGIK